MLNVDIIYRIIFVIQIGNTLVRLYGKRIVSLHQYKFIQHVDVTRQRQRRATNGIRLLFLKIASSEEY